MANLDDGFKKRFSDTGTSEDETKNETKNETKGIPSAPELYGSIINGNVYIYQTNAEKVDAVNQGVQYEKNVDKHNIKTNEIEKNSPTKATEDDAGNTDQSETKDNSQNAKKSDKTSLHVYAHTVSDTLQNGKALDQENRKRVKNLPEKISELPVEDFILALTVTLLNYGEHELVSNFYDYLLTEKYESVIKGEVEQSNNQPKSDSAKTLRKSPPRAINIFGRGFEQRLKSIDAQYDERVVNINGIQQRIRIIKFKNTEHFVNMWNIWRNEYPQFLSDLKPELLFLLHFGDYYTRILVAHSLGEIACTNVTTITSEYLDKFATSRDLQVRYNVGYILWTIIANDQKNKKYIFDLLEKWLEHDWRSRWTVAASISRIYKFDIKGSIHILTQITELSEKLSRDKNAEEPYYQLNPLTMIWHSASILFIDGHVTEILDMLHLWLITKNRNKQALPDIARELYLDIMQSYFDIRANSLVSDPERKKNKHQERFSDVKPVSNDEGKERNTDTKDASPAVSSETKPDPNNSASELDANPEKQDLPANEKPEPESKEQSLESSSDEEKSEEFVPKENDGSSSFEEPNLVEKQDASPSEVQSEFQIHANSTTIGNVNINVTISNQEKDKSQENTEEKSIDDIINRIDINSVNKVLWKELSGECNSKKNGAGTYTRIIVDLTLESLRRGWAKSLANPWFDPDRNPPYKRMQDIIHKWLELSMEDDFEHIQDPLYVILMECYVRLSVDIRDAKLKDKLQKWYTDQNEKDLYQYSFIKEVLDAMNHVSNQITTTEPGG